MVEEKGSRRKYIWLTLIAAAGVVFQIIALGARSQLSDGSGIAQGLAVSALLLVIGWVSFSAWFARNARSFRALEAEHGSYMWLSSRVPGMTEAAKSLGGTQKPSSQYAVQLCPDQLKFFAIPSGEKFLTVAYGSVLRVEIGRALNSGSSSDALFVIVDAGGKEVTLPFVLALRGNPGGLRIQKQDQLRESKQQLLDILASRAG